MEQKPLVDLQAFVRQTCAKYNNDRRRLIDILWDTQREFQCINGKAMALMAAELSTQRIDIQGVVSFYAFFSETPKGKITIRLCDDIIDRFKGSKKIARIFVEELGIEIGQTSADGNFSLEYCPCIGMCDQAPAALINDVVVTNLTVQSARQICQSLLENHDPTRLVTQVGDGNNGHELIRSMVNNNIRQADKVLLTDYFEPEAGLGRALKMSEKAVVQEIIDSELKGRGGAGFLTGTKWKMAQQTPAEARYVICNADEGEPGTFKDRVLLTERADLLIEGMTIAAHAIRSQHGLIYLRAEYAYLRPYLEHILQQRRGRGLLGENIGGKTGFNFDIRIQLGAGAYICGEESSLISSCEGLRGEPKNRPPFPVEKGYLGCPTIVNNVETFCCVPRILDQGAQWFAAIGTPASRGTRLLSIAGDCEKPGVYEVPFGIKVSELLELTGANDAAIVCIGGASGEMIGRTAFDRSICFGDLPTGGAVMIFNSRRNVMEVVDYFLEFFIDESCGYCTPCRVGNVFLRERIRKIMKGHAEGADLDYLKELSQTIIMTSRCGLGKTSPKPVLSSMVHFPLVYSALVKESADGLQPSFDIQGALEESRRLAKRRSLIYDPVFGDGNG